MHKRLWIVHKIGTAVIMMALASCFSETCGKTGCSPETGYDLWLRYRPVTDTGKLNNYRDRIRYAVMEGDAPELEVARQEFICGISGLLGADTELRRRGSVSTGPQRAAMLSISTLSLSVIFTGTRKDVRRSCSCGSITSPGTIP